MKELSVFKRYELKYVLSLDQYNELKEIMKNFMDEDEFGVSTINNVYFDTPSYLLIRNSIEKTGFKEKLRVRSYGTITKDSKVFIEMKRKCNGLVYKRRLAVPYEEGYNFLVNNKPLLIQNQISRELDYFVNHYNTLLPKMKIDYQREAFFGKEDRSFRITFDYNIKVNRTEFENEVQSIIEDDQVLLEVKISKGYPQWLLDYLNHNHIYKTSFSKYGMAYKKIVLSEKIEGDITDDKYVY